MKKNFSLAFTLAEVLITLGIIGVVAAMTLPALIQNYNEKVTVTRVKKAYSIFSQAYERVKEDYGTPDLWNLEAGSADSSKEYINRFKPYINITKVCTAEENCYVDNLYDLSKNEKHPWNDRMYAQTNDGTIFWIYVFSSDCSYNVSDTNTHLQNICAEIAVDVNGKNQPNTYGHDLFYFWITKDLIIPKGTQDEDSTKVEGCDISKTNNNNGNDCAAWVIFNENLDYLHCSDLSWTGKKSCKK